MTYLVEYKIGTGKQVHLFESEWSNSRQDVLEELRDRLEADADLNILDVMEFQILPDYGQGQIASYFNEYEVGDGRARLSIHHVSELQAVRDELGVTQNEVQYIELEVGDVISEEMLELIIWKLFYEPNQVHSSYDCSGQKFVMFVDTFMNHDTFNESRNAIVALRWGIDI